MVYFSWKVVKQMPNIGINIKNRRLELKMTQTDLAQKLGYKSKSTINKIENGTNDIPQSKIVKFAEALETTPSALMGWEKVQKNNDIISDIVLRMMHDSDFFDVAKTLYNLDSEKISGVKQMLSAFLK